MHDYIDQCVRLAGSTTNSAEMIETAAAGMATRSLEILTAYHTQHGFDERDSEVVRLVVTTMQAELQRRRNAAIQPSDGDI